MSDSQTSLDLEVAFQKIREEARAKAGEPSNILPRVKELHNLFEDSQGNHVFPELALHGALWAWNFFETKGKLGKVIQWRYFYTARERAYRMQLLNDFAEGFKAANCDVFCDTYTNYHFSKLYGTQPGAEKYVHPELLALLNNMHAQIRAGNSLNQEERAQLYAKSLELEQELTVVPKIRKVMEGFDCPVLKWFLMKPTVRFKFFPRNKFYWFKNFSDQSERVKRAMNAYNLAESIGWDRVVAARHEYGADI